MAKFLDKKGNLVPENVDRLKCIQRPTAKASESVECEVYSGVKHESVSVQRVEVEGRNIASNEPLGIDFERGQNGKGVVDITTVGAPMKCRVENPSGYAGSVLTLKCRVGED